MTSVRVLYSYRSVTKEGHLNLPALCECQLPSKLRGGILTCFDIYAITQESPGHAGVETTAMEDVQSGFERHDRLRTTSKYLGRSCGTAVPGEAGSVALSKPG